MKVVLNQATIGFRLSPKAIKRLIEWDSPLIDKEVLCDFEKEELKDTGDGYQSNWLNDVVKGDFAYHVVYPLDRSHPDLVFVVEELGQDSWGDYSALKVVEIPDGIEWEVETIGDGDEKVVEKHRSWK